MAKHSEIKAPPMSKNSHFVTASKQDKELADCLINSLALLANPWNMEFYFWLICMLRSITDSDLFYTDNTVPFKNTTSNNQNKGQNKRTQSRLI